MIDSPFDAAQSCQQPDSRGACVRVNLSAIAHNVKMMKEMLGDVRMMAVVKANAYGHGLLPVARTAVSCGADYLGVALPEEGAAIRQGGIDAPCLVLGNISEGGARISAQYGLVQTVCDAAGVELMQRVCEEANLRTQVHLKIDTGMSRIGARTQEDVARVLQALEKADRVQLTGAFTHFADASNEESVRGQFKRFEMLAKQLPQDIILHAAASEAAIRYPWARLDMARMGIALYGCEGENVYQAMRWETRVAYVKEIQAGDRVSYGGDFCADKPMRVATIAVGYGDGYLRAFSGRAQVLIHGARCPVLGRVCMDQTMVDVTHVPDVKTGDETVLLGNQGDDCISAHEMAKWAGTICYEALLLHAGRVPVMIENEN